ncbi:MAG: spherulation-specific family 4 protein [Patescibacteria group bacterium]|nr:spherulation-specific family 4 protein [Patescibacteria group bacterium]
MLSSKVTCNVGPNAGLLIPLYSDPDRSWSELAMTRISSPSIRVLAVINPRNGPGSDIDSKYVMGVRQLRASGIDVLGYVHTKYGARNVALLRNEVDSYAEWYGVDGILFDEMANTPGKEPYYAGLTTYAKQKGMQITLGNPGADTTTSYVDTVDNLVLYDNPDLPPESLFSGWHLNFDKSKFSFVSYGVKKINKELLRKIAGVVGYFFVTDGEPDNPWNGLPSYFGDLVQFAESMRPMVEQKA